MNAYRRVCREYFDLSCLMPNSAGSSGAELYGTAPFAHTGKRSMASVMREMKVRAASLFDSPIRYWLKAYPVPRLYDDELGTKGLLLFDLARMCHQLHRSTVWFSNRCGSRTFTSMPRCDLLSSRDHTTVIIIFRVVFFHTKPLLQCESHPSFLPRSFR